MSRRLLCRVRETPALIWCALALCLGIVLGRGAAEAWPMVLAMTLAAAAGLLLPRHRLLAGLVLFAALGGLRSQMAWHPATPEPGMYQVTATVADNVQSGQGTQHHVRLKDLRLNDQPTAGAAYWSFYGAEPPELEAGARVSFTGMVSALPEQPDNPGGFDFLTYALQQGMAFRLQGREELTVSPGPWDLYCMLARWRWALSRALCGVMGEEAGGYAAAMLLGERSLIDPDGRLAFSRLGVAHILAVSGFHVGVIAGVLACPWRLLHLGRRTRYVLTLLVLCMYCLLTGAASSSVRATLMWALYGGGRLCRRRGDSMTLLSVAALVMLVAQPVQLWSAGFQLSFAAVAGIALVTPWLRMQAHPAGAWTKRLWDSAAVTLGAQTGLLLPLCGWFQQLPLLGLVVNILLLPWAACLMYLYMAAALLLPVPWLGAAAGKLAAVCTTGTVRAVQALSTLPGVSLWTDMPGVLGWLGAALVLFALAVRSWAPAGRRILLGSVGGLCLTLALIPWPTGEVSWTQLSVGNGDAAVIRDRGETWALDTGAGDELAIYLRQRRLSLKGLVLTHLQRDHAGGIRALLAQGIPVERCYIPCGAEHTADPDCSALLAELAAAGTEIHPLSRGDVLPLPSGSVEVLWPVRDCVAADAAPGDFCLATLWTLRGGRVLAMGDLTGAYEQRVMQPADVLKVGSHGTKRSTFPPLCRESGVGAALVSSGDRRRGAAVQARLEGAQVWDTSVCGAVQVRFGAEACAITPRRGREDTDGV